MSNKNQKILNAKIRLAVRTGELPFTFEDEQEKTYRKIVYDLGRELNKKFTVSKIGKEWTISNTN